jgi:hypothetical protein
MPKGERGESTITSPDLLFEDLRKLFAPQEGDVIIIVGAHNIGLAEHGAMAVAMTVLD